MSRYLDIHVYGTPGSQGHKVAGITRGGKSYVRESNNARLRAWKTEVRQAAMHALKQSATGGFSQGPVLVHMTFYLRRPLGHYRIKAGKPSTELKPSAPKWPAGKPDRSSLQRSTEDAMTEAGVYRDDSQIVAGLVEKRYADDRPAGASIYVESLLNGEVIL